MCVRGPNQWIFNIQGIYEILGKKKKTFNSVMSRNFKCNFSYIMCLVCYELTFHIFGLMDTMHCLQLDDPWPLSSSSSTGARSKQTDLHFFLCHFPARIPWTNVNIISPIQGNLSSSRNIFAQPSCENTYSSYSDPSPLEGGKLQPRQTWAPVTHPDEEGCVKNVLYCPGKGGGVDDKLVIWYGS